MRSIAESQRLPAPAQLPQALAWRDDSLWMGSLHDQRIYQIDTQRWTVAWQTEAPGKPFGMVSVGPELTVLCGETDQDLRILRRLRPGQGFDPDYRLPCPDDTGSQLSWDGRSLHLSQWYNKRILALNDAGHVERVYQAPRGICGQTIVGNELFLITTDAEETDQYVFGRIDLATGRYHDLAAIRFPARALAHDGRHFWTNHRAAHQTVAFTLP